jgi:hypothetical protein
VSAGKALKEAPSRTEFRRTYPGTTGHISAVRDGLRALLHGCPMADDVILCASELATNAGAPRGALSYPWRSREELEGGFWV